MGRTGNNQGDRSYAKGPTTHQTRALGLTQQSESWRSQTKREQGQKEKQTLLFSSPILWPYSVKYLYITTPFSQWFNNLHKFMTKINHPQNPIFLNTVSFWQVEERLIWLLKFIWESMVLLLVPKFALPNISFYILRIYINPHQFQSVFKTLNVLIEYLNSFFPKWLKNTTSKG